MHHTDIRSQLHVLQVLRPSPPPTLRKGLDPGQILVTYQGHA